MDERTQRLAHLEQLAAVLGDHGFRAKLVGAVAKPYLKVANSGTPSLNERVLCEPADNGAWSFRWPWKQPIGSADDLETVVEKIAAVLRSVEADEADER
jgi:hypothetical protein